MLPWPQINLNRKQQLILKIVLAVIILHLLFFIAFFFLGNKPTFNRSITLNALPSNDVKVVFLPLYKSIKNQPVAVTAHVEKSKSKVVSQKVAPKAAPKQVSKPTATQIRKNTPTKSVAPQKTAPKAVSKPASKPVTAKQIVKPAAPKPVAPQKTSKPVAKPQTKPLAAQPQNRQEPVKSEAEKKENVVAQEQKKKSDTIASQELPTHLDLSDENVLYVGQEEHALITIQKDLQKELARCWKAPTMMIGNPSCDLLVKVDGNGKAHQVKVAKPSSAKLYDMLAQKAFRAINYPKELWGQEITFTFKGH